MRGVLILMAVQGALGAFDTLYHHELTERLPWRPEAGRELAVHALRNLIYAGIFLGFAWTEWHGLWALAVIVLMAVEILATLVDFVIEDRTRDLPASERITHTLLAINFGVILAVLAPSLARWIALPTGIAPASHGLWSWISSAIAIGAAAWTARDGTRSTMLRRRQADRAPPLAAPLSGRLSILVTGGTGFIGTRLCEVLAEAGHRVTVLTRDNRRGRKFRGRVTLIENLHTLGRDTPFDAIVNLAGEPIAAGRWTEARKRKIRDSRLAVTDAVIRFIARSRHKPSVLVSGSAIGVYGVDDETVFTEASEGRPCFTEEVCRAWEQAARAAERHGVRVCLLRTGLVLGASGGALARMLPPFELGLGGPIGRGRQWMSWIHLDDLVGLIIHAIAVETVRGPLNGTAPEPVRNDAFARALGRALHRPVWLPMPAFTLRLALGQLADELLLGGQRVLPKQAEETGYLFAYPTLDTALKEIVG